MAIIAVYGNSDQRVPLYYGHALRCRAFLILSMEANVQIENMVSPIIFIALLVYLIQYIVTGCSLIDLFSSACS